MPQTSGSQQASPIERGVRPPLRVGIILADHFTLSAFAVCMRYANTDRARVTETAIEAGFADCARGFSSS